MYELGSFSLPCTPYGVSFLLFSNTIFNFHHFWSSSVMNFPLNAHLFIKNKCEGKDRDGKVLPFWRFSAEKSIHKMKKQSINRRIVEINLVVDTAPNQSMRQRQELLSHTFIWNCMKNENSVRNGRQAGRQTGGILNECEWKRRRHCVFAHHWSFNSKSKWKKKHQADTFGVLEKINTPKHHKGNCPLINNLYSENFSSFRITLRHRERTASANSSAGVYCVCECAHAMSTLLVPMPAALHPYAPIHTRTHTYIYNIQCNHLIHNNLFLIMLSPHVFDPIAVQEFYVRAYNSFLFICHRMEVSMIFMWPLSVTSLKCCLTIASLFISFYFHFCSRSPSSCVHSHRLASPCLVLFPSLWLFVLCYFLLLASPLIFFFFLYFHEPSTNEKNEHKRSIHSSL